MYSRQLFSQIFRALSVRRILPVAALLALVFSGTTPLQAGKCPPCSGDANECAFACCLYQDCNSWNIVSCTAWCSLGYAVAEVLEDGETAPAFKSFSGQSQADCRGENKIGAILIPPVNSRNTKKRLEVALLSTNDRKFLTTAEDVVGVVVEIARKQDYQASAGRPRWEPLGRASFSADAGAWVLDWNLAAYSANDYVVRAIATRKDGRVQEARGVAASVTY